MIFGGKSQHGSKPFVLSEPLWCCVRLTQWRTHLDHAGAAHLAQSYVFPFDLEMFSLSQQDIKY